MVLVPVPKRPASPLPVTLSAYPAGRLTSTKRLKKEKVVLREEMRRRRQDIPAEERERLASRIEDALFALPEVAAAGTILLFYSFGTEVATAGMAERVLKEGKRLLLPYLENQVMGAAEVRPGDQLMPTGYGPKEPVRRIAVNPEDVDVVVAPGLAYDRRGHRLGYGAGYYDLYLSRLNSRAARIGVAYSVQVVDRVPVGPKDAAVDLLVTDRGSFDCRAVQ
jgi:5-formyltetrahydrofolate cyclo-ligase